MKSIHSLLQLLLFIFAFGVIIACDQPPKITQTQKLHEKAMEIHDDVMPKTSDINRLARKLKEKRKTISGAESNDIRTIDSLVQDLNNADEVMMAWMRSYKTPDFADTTKLTHSNLNQQIHSIKEVKNAMESSIEKAKQYLDENE